MDKDYHGPEVRKSRLPEIWWVWVRSALLAVFLAVIVTVVSHQQTAAVETSGHPDSRTTGPSPVAVDLSATPATVNVGDSVSVTVTYRWPRGWTVQAPGGEPDPANDFAHAYVTDLPPARRTSTGDEERRVFHLTLAATTSGSWQLPLPTLTTTGPSGPVTATATPVIITVGAEDKPPQLPAARPAWTRAQEPGDGGMAWWALACALVALIGIGALLLNRQRRDLVLTTPWERFLDDWQAASTAADGKEAGARLSLALRRWLGELFQFDGAGSTSRETLTALRPALPDDERRRLGQLLDQLDGLRWAADDLAPSAVRPLIEDGRAWAVALKRRLDAEAEARAKAGAPGTSATATSTATTSTATTSTAGKPA